MFATFRPRRSTDYDDSDDGLELSAPPFRKQRIHLTPTACIRCRAKKIKCTGEAQGCRTCRVKHVQCTYPPRPLSSARQQQQQHRHGANSHSQEEAGSLHQGHDHDQTRDEASLFNDVDQFVPDAADNEFLHVTQFMMLQGIEEAFGNDGNTLSSRPPTDNNSPDGGGFHCAPPAAMASAQYTKAKAAAAALPLTPDTTYSTTTTATTTTASTSDPGGGGCCCCKGDNNDAASCVDRVLMAYEDLYLEMVLWKAQARDGGGGDDDDGDRDEPAAAARGFGLYGSVSRLFLYQKNAMVASKALLRCGSCSLRSEAMTQVASVCSVVLDSFKAVLNTVEQVAAAAGAGAGRDLPPLGQHRKRSLDTRHPKQEDRRSSSGGGRASVGVDDVAAVKRWSGRCASREVDSVVRDGGGPAGRTEDAAAAAAQKPLSLLDREDQAHVSRALVNLRMSQLDSLLTWVDEVVHLRGSIAQRILVQTTRTRLTNYIYSGL